VHSVTLLRRDTAAPTSRGSASAYQTSGGLRGSWSCLASIGADPCLRPEDGDTEVPVGDELALVLRGRVLASEDQRLLAAFAAQVAVAYQQRQLAQANAAAAPLAEADRMRTALLNAVSHDLRTPLASVKAAISSLRSTEVDWTPRDRDELLANADDSVDRLTELVTNLLDLSRLQAGVLSVGLQPVVLDDIVSLALDHSAQDRSALRARITLDLPENLPLILADPGLLERVIANLAENALRYSPAEQPIRVAASTHADTVELRVIDRGPGIADDDKESVFAPFQRRDDHAVNRQGVGLGLAIARGFIEAMHGTISLDDTPGGGLMAVISLPIAPEEVSS
jgi:two-component system sensor histidine kinase KdpD